MRLIVLLGVTMSLAISTASLAQTAEATVAATPATPLTATSVKSRMMVRDKTGSRIGPVMSVIAAADGSIAYVTVISGETAAKIPGSTLTLEGENLTTSLTRREVARLR